MVEQFDSRIERIEMNPYNLNILKGQVFGYLFGTQGVRDKTKRILLSTYIVYNEITENWQTLPKTEIDKERHTLATEIKGIVVGDDDLYLAVRRKTDEDLLKNRFLIYLCHWDLNEPPKKDQRAILF